MKLGFLALLGALLVLPTFAMAQTYNGTQVDGDQGGSTEGAGAVLDTGNTGNMGVATASSDPTGSGTVGNVHGGDGFPVEQIIKVAPPKDVGGCDIKQEFGCGPGEF